MRKRNNHTRNQGPKLKEFFNHLFGHVSDNEVLEIKRLENQPQFSQIIAELSAILEALDAKKGTGNLSDSENVFLPLIVDMITYIWRSQQKMLTPGSVEPLDEYKRMHRPLVSANDRWNQAGFEVKDRVNQRFDPGLLEKVIAYEPTPDLTDKKIIETLKPSIYYRGRLVQQGEIIVGVPPE